MTAFFIAVLVHTGLAGAAQSQYTDTELWQKRIAQWKQTLRQLSNPSKEVRLKYLFNLGMAESQLGHYKAAADYFYQMLVIDPSLLRPRLELGRVLFLAGDYSAAQYHFEQVLSKPLPPPVVANVMKFLAAIRARVPSWDLSLAFKYRNNPGQKTRIKRFTLFGLQYEVNEEDRPKGSWGLSLSANGRIPLGHTPWFLSASLRQTEYQDHRYGEGYYALGLGYTLKNTPRETWKLIVSPFVDRWDGDWLYHGVRTDVQGIWQVKPKVITSLNVSHSSVIYHGYDYMDARRYSTTLGADLAMSPTLKVWLNGTLLRNIARETPYSYWLSGAGTGLIWETGQGWVLKGSIQLQQYNYDANDLIFQKARTDVTKTLGITLFNRKWNWKGFVPQLEMSAMEENSTIEYYDKEDRSLSLGVSRRF